MWITCISIYKNCLLEFKYALESGTLFLIINVIIQQDEYCLNFTLCDRPFAVDWRLFL